MSDDFDHMAVVVDWLDACRSRNIEALLDCYAEDGSLECGCEGINVDGRAALAAYWKPRLESFAPDAFGLEEIKPVAEGVMLEYLNHAGRPIKVVFTFGADGRIAHMRCTPASA